MGSHSSDSLCGAVLHETYRLTRVIGKGGMGTVYEAVHTRLHKKRFALKILQLAAARSPELFARFRREAEIATELGHPNIVEVLDFNCTDEGQPYIVMELLEGENLRARLERERTLAPAALLQVMEPVCDALHAVHAIGVVHRDMKPENIFLVRGHRGAQQVKVLDFGISKIQHDSSVVTQLHAVFGTPHYMSPEQASGAVDQIDPTTDIFALGTICYLALSGAWPFDGATAFEIRHNVCYGQPRPVTELVPGLPFEVDRVLGLALAKEQHERHQRATDLFGALRAALEQSHPIAGVTAEPLEPTLDTPTVREPSPGTDGPDLPASPDEPSADRAMTTLSGATGEAGRKVTTRGPRGSYRLMAVSCVAALVAGFLVVWVAMRAGGVRPSRPGAIQRRSAELARPVSRPTPVAGQLQAADAASAQKRARVLIRLDVQPRGARVLLDGQARRDSPLVLQRSDRRHTLRIEAVGHEPIEHTFAADGSRSIVVKLGRARRRPSGGKAASRGRRGRLVDKPTSDWEDPYPSDPGRGAHDDDWADPYARKRREKAR